MPKFDKPKRLAKRAAIYKDVDEEISHIDELSKRCIDEVQLFSAKCPEYFHFTRLFHAQAPARGSQYDTGAEYDDDAQLFSNFPLSRRTMRGLDESKFEKMTRIQAAGL
jgi:hypothetical protein